MEWHKASVCGINNTCTYILAGFSPSIRSIITWPSIKKRKSVQYLIGMTEIASFFCFKNKTLHNVDNFFQIYLAHLTNEDNFTQMTAGVILRLANRYYHKSLRSTRTGCWWMGGCSNCSGEFYGDGNLINYPLGYNYDIKTCARAWMRFQYTQTLDQKQ